MNQKYKDELTKANNSLLTSQNAARATLEEVKLAFPQCAAITNQAAEVCRDLLKHHRKVFDNTVKDLFLTMSTVNTIKI